MLYVRKSISLNYTCKRKSFGDRYGDLKAFLECFPTEKLLTSRQSKNLSNMQHSELFAPHETHPELLGQNCSIPVVESTFTTPKKLYMYHLCHFTLLESTVCMYTCTCASRSNRSFENVVK